MEPTQDSKIEAAKEEIQMRILACESVTIEDDDDLINAEVTIKQARIVVLDTIDTFEYKTSTLELTLPLEKSINRLRTKMVSYRIKRGFALYDFSFFTPSKFSLN